MYSVVIKYKGSDETSYEVRKDRLVEVISKIIEVEELESLKILPMNEIPSLKNDFSM